jgi:hypothetical protein
MNANGVEILDRLREAGETTLRFSAWGFGGQLKPSDSAAYLSSLLSHARLVDAVPEDVRSGFERVRKALVASRRPGESAGAASARGEC